MEDKFFAAIEISYWEDNVPREAKMIVHVASLDEAYQEVTRYIGKYFESISIYWIGQPYHNGKSELFFTESEFDRFDTVKRFIEDDLSIKDFERAEKRYMKLKER